MAWQITYWAYYKMFYWHNLIITRELYDFSISILGGRPTQCEFAFYTEINDGIKNKIYEFSHHTAYDVPNELYPTFNVIFIFIFLFLQIWEHFTWRLGLAMFACCIGSSFLFGYSTGVVNSPQHVSTITVDYCNNLHSDCAETVFRNGHHRNPEGF